MEASDSSLGGEEAKQQPPLSLQHVVDDFSLQSQGIRFRAGRREMKIYEQPHGQLILEQLVAPDDDEEQVPQDNEVVGFLVKTINDKSYGFSFLRTAYSLIAFFVGGFLFILGFDLLLFLFIDLATKLGVTSNGSMQLFDVFAVLLSVPVFIYSLAMGMTLVGTFVTDTFYGHPFLRSFGLGVATTDWMAFVLYLGVPILAFIITLFSKMDNWWELSLLTWFASILIFWCLFSACVLYFDTWVFLKLMEEDDASSLLDDDPWKARVKYWLKQAGNGCVRTMRYRLSGIHVHSMQMNVGKEGTLVNNKITAFISEDLFSQGPYSYIANKEWNPCTVKRQPPERIHTLDDVLERRAYVTRYSWSLEKLFCRSGGFHSSIPITRGDSSITKAQINSNIACNIIGNGIGVLLFSSAVVWFEPPPALFGVVIAVAVVFFIWVGFATYRLFGLRKDIVNNAGSTLYRYSEIYQHSMPKDHFIWAVVFLQVCLLYLLPLIYLCNNNSATATLFGFLGLFSSLRHYMNPRIVLLEKKKYFSNTLEVKTKEDRKKWKKKSLLRHLVAVGGDSARRFWIGAYTIFVLFFVLVVVWAHAFDQNYQKQSPDGQKNKMTLVTGYAYEPQPHLPYPTCLLQKGLGGYSIDLADFAFLSNLAYSTDDSATALLETWFGSEVTATNNVTLIEEFKNSSDFTDYGFVDNAVSYKLITVLEVNGAVLTIRGTQTPWDLMADAQLWMSAMLFQGLRFILPLSELWTPILHHMVWIVTQLESESIEQVAFYRETIGFVEYLKKEKGLDVVVTGHSLGGGLAIITGAESNTSAVAISGPNAMLSRNSFFPPVTVENLNTLTFNVVPARDPIPMIDDKAKLYQNINCTANANDLVGCHDSTRSLCEIQYTCGSSNRPVLCECVLDYGYPEPSLPYTNQTNTNQTTAQTPFIQICIDMCEGEDGGETLENCARWKEALANKK
ncbi:hypothetical protein ACHAXR_012175 [Thalassiosira sp. AJA248-18]